MKRITRKALIAEIIHFCQNLTQFKYDEEYDSCIKNLLKQNLKLLDSLKTTATEKIEDKLLGYCDDLVQEKFGTEDDKTTKELIAFQLTRISKHYNKRKADWRDKKETEKLARLQACM